MEYSEVFQAIHAMVTRSNEKRGSYAYPVGSLTALLADTLYRLDELDSRTATRIVNQIKELEND